jgi:hypothetical protein
MTMPTTTLQESIERSVVSLDRFLDKLEGCQGKLKKKDWRHDNIVGVNMDFLGYKIDKFGIYPFVTLLSMALALIASRLELENMGSLLEKSTPKSGTINSRRYLQVIILSIRSSKG